MKFFSPDSAVYKFMVGVTNVFVLNVCFLLTCIPIITIGTSIISVYEVTLKMVDDEEGYVGKQYFKAWKGNLKNGIILEIITLLCAYVLWMDFQLFDKLPNNPIYLLIIGIVTAFFFIFSLLYAYPQAARYTNTVPRMLRNSFRLSMKYFGRSIVLVVVLALEIAVFTWNTTLMFLGLLIGPVFFMLTISFVAKGIFKKVEADQASGETESDN